ncbi:MAG: hypothetical protein WC378_10735 [Opitutaceae bacterium]|jgi:hypothetical protein
MSKDEMKRPWLALACILTALKLWLTAGQPIFGIGGASYDDRLFLELANSLLRGEWLGGYQPLTLAKGPFYSMWIAAVHTLGLPLRLAEQLAYACACVLVVVALAPVLRSAWKRTAVYALLLWNPMTFEGTVLGRVLRQNIYTPLTVLVFACLIALYLRAGSSGRRLLPWALGLGLASAAFYLTREESVWIVPSALLLGLAACHRAWREGGKTSLKSLAAAASAAAFCAALPVLAVCALNARHYGWFGTVEFRAQAFNDAYGALLRVKPAEEIPFVPVTRETRERIYKASPAFAELRPFLEGDLGRAWAANSSFVTHLPDERLEIAGGWFMWALRDAVRQAGHAPDAGSALAFYRRIADEVNAACDAGRLPAGPRRSGFLPPWRKGQTALLAKSFVEFADAFASFSKFTAYAPPSIGDDNLLSLFRDLTRERMSSSPDVFSAQSPRTAKLDLWKVDVLQAAGKVLRRILFALVLAAHAIVILRVVQAWRLRTPSPLLVVAAASWGGCAACLLINALVNVTSFPTLSTGSFAQAYPLILLFVAVVGCDAADNLPKAGRSNRVPG